MDHGKDSISHFYCTVDLDTYILHSLKNPYNILPLQACSILLVLFYTESWMIWFFDFPLKSWMCKTPSCLMGFADWICLMRLGPCVICGPSTWVSFDLAWCAAALLQLWCATSCEPEMWDLGSTQMMQFAMKTWFKGKNELTRYWSGIYLMMIPFCLSVF